MDRAATSCPAHRQQFRGRCRPPFARIVRAAARAYQDLRTGKTWSERGRPPEWIAGKHRERFLIPCRHAGASVSRPRPCAASAGAHRAPATYTRRRNAVP
ncbi:H-NS family nucleoid-associated regulatory protein [Mycetohabitans sp. B46]|uniref:H-NS family nucleoid-associated regulatory protein n=1 Tax=Mycetohabitans sp. B46 TaxID=2772536 RepID=UPI003FD5C516